MCNYIQWLLGEAWIWRWKTLMHLNVLCKTYMKDLENQTLNHFPNTMWKVENVSVIWRSFCLLFIFLYYGTSISIVYLILEWLNAGHVLYFHPSFCLTLSSSPSDPFNTSPLIFCMLFTIDISTVAVLWNLCCHFP